MAGKKAEVEATQRNVNLSQAVQNAFVTLAAFFVFCVACVAWFMNNTKVTGDGVQIQTEGIRFELATHNEPGRTVRDVALPGLDALFGLSENQPVDNFDRTVNGQPLGVYLSDTVNFKNNKEGAKLEPGDFGKITFYLHPLAGDIPVFYLDIDLQGYLRSEAAAELPTSVTPVDDGGIAAALLQGHVLLFRNYNENEVSAPYSDWITGQLAIYPGPDTTLILQPAGEERPQSAAKAFTQDVYYEVSFYWIWPKYFRNYAYTNMTQGDLFGDTGNDDYQAIVADMNKDESAKKYFYQEPGEGEAPASMEAKPVQGSISNQMSDDDRNLCTVAYNEGDQYLGETLGYVCMQMTVSEETNE